MDFRREGFSPSLTLLMSAFALPIPPAALTSHLHRPTERSATTPEGRTQKSDIRTAAMRAEGIRAISRYSPRQRSAVASSIAEVAAIKRPHPHLVRRTDGHDATHRSFIASAVLTPEVCLPESAASVHGFSPVTFSARDSLSRPVSYYAFFKGWLLLSQPPGCLGRPTSFPT